jgi:hypothetical protein
MEKEKNDQLGGIASIFGAVLAIVGNFYLFQNWYFRGMHAESAEEGCEILLKYIHPALTDLGLLAGALFVVAAFGFFKKQKWAFFLSVVAIVFSLQATWFINVPYMAAGLPPIYFTLFFPFVVLYFVLMRGVGKLEWNRIWVALFAGLTFVLTLMNGVSSLSRIITIGAPIFVMTQRLHWVAMIGCGTIAVGIAIRPQRWMWVTGLASCVLELILGIPLAFVTMRELGRFSLFSLAPIGCLLFLVVILWPGLWESIETDGEEETLTGEGAASLA